MNARFTIDGSEALELRLALICDQVRERVQAIMPPDRLEGLVLGGGYGRGEGGVLRTSAGDQPYNDLEFYVFVNGKTWLNERRYGDAFHAAAEELSASAGLEVELKLLSLEKLRRSPVTMFYYDLLLGHRWILGEDSFFAGCEHHRSASRIPLAEATRLLMNRCSGLLFAKERLNRMPFSAEDADFVGRNLAKARLAFGDVVLAACGQYHSSCRKRHQRLEKLIPEEELPWFLMVQQEHMAGVEFKLHPCRSTEQAESLLRQLDHLAGLGLAVWLWLESRRLHEPFSSARAYAFSGIDKCPETPAWRNCLVNLKSFGFAPSALQRLHRYPRERLLESLALLLWENESVNDPKLLRKVQRDLGTNGSSFTSLVQAFRALWSRFN